MNTYRIILNKYLNCSLIPSEGVIEAERHEIENKMIFIYKKDILIGGFHYQEIREDKNIYGDVAYNIFLNK